MTARDVLPGAWRGLRLVGVTTFGVRSVYSYACQSREAEDGMALWIQWSMGLACLIWGLVKKQPMMSSR